MKPHDAPDNDQPASQRPATDEDGLIRLQKLLAQSGVASRRKCEELMLDGLVEVDGEVVTRLGTKVDPRTAVVRVDGKRLPPISDKVYLVLNKPRGVVSTMSDPEGRRTLGDLVADRPERLFHVGRLDGDDLTVETPYGPQSFKLPAGTQTGQRFRIANHGVPRADSAEAPRGSLYVHVRVVVPKKLSEQQKELLREFAHTPAPRQFVERRARFRGEDDAHGVVVHRRDLDRHELDVHPT